MKAAAIFCAKQLVYIEAVLGIAAIVMSLPLRRHLVRRRWLVSTVVLFAASGLMAVCLSQVVHSPRPFVVDGFKALFPHAPTNGFPSHHALLAAAVVASVALLNWRLAIPLALLAGLVEWGRVACNVHHNVDVMGANLIVLLATLVAVRVARQVRQIGPVESDEGDEPLPAVRPIYRTRRQAPDWRRESPELEEMEQL